MGVIEALFRKPNTLKPVIENGIIRPAGLSETSNRLSPQELRIQAKPYLEKYRRALREQISDGISSAVSEAEKIIELAKVKKPLGPEQYHPSNRKEVVIEKQSQRIRVRRASRCNGVHDAESDPCGSPRCRSKGRVKAISREQNRHYRRNPLKSEKKVK